MAHQTTIRLCHPHVTVEMDPDGIEAHRFSAATSGQTALYDPRGRLVFSGGITSSRGHEVDNIGASAILSVIEDAAAPSIRMLAGKRKRQHF